MPMKASGPATEWREIDRWEGGVGWIAHPEERMERASHALAVGDDVWVVDPVDAPGIDDLLAEFGDVAGVVVLLDRHTRDAATIANRHGVSVHVPAQISGVASDIDAPVETERTELADTGYGIHEAVDLPFWHESVLYGEDDGTMVVADSLGTASYFVTGDERLGVSAPLRPFPPKKLARLDPERVLVGHGEGVFEDADEALETALRGARRRAPSLFAKNVRLFSPL